MQNAMTDPTVAMEEGDLQGSGVPFVERARSMTPCVATFRQTNANTALEGWKSWSAPQALNADAISDHLLDKYKVETKSLPKQPHAALASLFDLLQVRFSSVLKSFSGSLNWHYSVESACLIEPTSILEPSCPGQPSDESSSEHAMMIASSARTRCTRCIQCHSLLSYMHERSAPAARRTTSAL